MRGNLWDDPRVSAIVDATDSSEAAVVGALYWLWATADQHTEDGILPGLSLRQIDRKTGVKGFAEAIVTIGWIEECADGIRIVRFDEHNGASAKKRCQTAKRVANFKANGKEVTQESETGNAVSVTGALPRDREEKEIDQEQKQKKGRASAPACPEDVEPKVWADWLALRRAKRAPVSETVIREARKEAAKAGMTLDRFLEVWCARGSQGLAASWLKPHERAGPRGSPEKHSGFEQRDYGQGGNL